MAPSANVTSRTPGAISRPGCSGSTGLGGGEDGGASPDAGAAVAGAATAGTVGAVGGAAGGAVAGAAATTEGLTAALELVVGSGAGSRGMGGRAVSAGDGRASAVRAGRTSASSRFFASDEKAPLGYLSRYARISSGRLESRTLTQNSRSIESVMSALGPVDPDAVAGRAALALNAKSP